MEKQSIKKAVSISILSFAVLLVFSCSLISDIKNFEKPESLGIKSSGAEYSVPLGDAESKLKENLSIAKIEEMVAKQSKEKADSNPALKKAKVEIYDFLDSSENDVQKYIFDYQLADIPLDFSSYLKKLDKFNFNSNENSISQKITIPKDNINFSQNLNLNFDDVIRNSVNIPIPQILIPQTGNPSSPSIDIDRIPVNFSNPDFSSIEFSQGNLIFSFEELPDSDGGNPLISLQATIYDSSETQISSSAGYSVVREQDGTLHSLLIPMAGKTLTKNIFIALSAKSQHGILGKISKFKAELKFSNDTKIKKASGLTISQEILAPHFFNISTTIDTSSIKNILKSGKINSGSISYYLKIPSTWTGIQISPNISLSQDLNVAATDFTDCPQKDGSVVNKSANLNGKLFEPNAGIKVEGQIPFSINNATLTLSDSDQAVFFGGGEFSKIDEAKIYADKILDSATATKSISQSFGNGIQEFVESVDFSKIGLEGNLSSDLPRSNLKLTPSVTSNFFAIPATSPISQEIKFAESSSSQISLVKEYEPSYRVSDFSHDVDLKIEMKISSDDAIEPNLVTFESITLGKNYTVNFAVTPIFDWEELSIKAFGKTIEGTFESGFSLNSLLKTGISDNAIINDLLSNVEFSPSTLSGYLFITKPKMNNQDGEDFFKSFDKLTGNVKGIYGSHEDYIFPSSGTSGNLKFAKNVKTFAELADSEKVIRDISPAFENATDMESRKIKGETLLAMINSKDDFSLKYNLGIQTSETGSTVIRKADVESLKNLGQDTSIKVSIAMIFALKLNVTNAIRIDDTFSAFGLELKDDLLGRNDENDVSDFKEFADLVKEVKLKYLFKNNSGFNVSAYLTAADKDGNIYLGQSGTEYTKKLEIKSNSTSNWENDSRSINLSHSEIESLFNNYPFIPKVTLEIKPGEIKIPRNASFGARAVLTAVTDGKYKIWGDKK
ncbi:hypothetical protein HRO26_05595 [Treponema pectinovorum]|uniref:hypothetical protein n=1 Tax=Treponema pectinovorum TaxID=164 RepID=UPI003D8DE6B5